LPHLEVLGRALGLLGAGVGAVGLALGVKDCALSWAVGEGCGGVYDVNYC
jgi:hypothetical protein